MSWRRAWRTTARPKSHYSAPERARFGVWLCVPTTLFRVLEVGHTRISSLVHVPDDTSDAQPASRVGPDVAANVFLEAHKRNNQLVCALLRHLETGQEFIFAGFHSPCCFWWPGVMTLSHAAVKVELMRLRSTLGREFLLAGDFNIVPGSAAMEFMLSGQLADEVRPAASWVPPAEAAVPLVPLVSLPREAFQCLQWRVTCLSSRGVSPTPSTAPTTYPSGFRSPCAKITLRIALCLKS